MRSLLFSVLAFGAAACASSPSSSSGGGAAAAPAPAPAAQPATRATAPAPSGGGAANSANPCAAGGCTIKVSIESAITDQLNSEKNLTFKVLKGCPKANGGTTVDAIRASTPIANTRNTTIPLPAFQGTKATLAFWFGAQIDKMAVVDFSSGTTQTVKAPYMQSSSGFSDDRQITLQNTQAIQRCT